MTLTRDGVPVERVLAQQKRFGLLAYLALRRPHGYLSRNELMGVFWPESTEARARASLRQALRFLRGHLGSDVIVNRGDGQVRIPEEALECDAVAFLAALEAKDESRAVEVYAGDLLPGLLLPGVHEFDRWLHAERQRLRAAAIQAALGLGGRARSEGDPGRGADHVRWALKLDPTNEAVARTLMSLLAEVGDRASALAVHEELVARLAEELELEPSEETAALVEALRDGSEEIRGSGGEGGDGRLSRRRILVLPLEDLVEDLAGDERAPALGRLAADVIAQGLAGLPESEVVPPMAAMGSGSSGRVSAKRAGERAGERTAREAGLPEGTLDLARATGAGTVVGGVYWREEDRVQFQVKCVDLTGGGAGTARLLESPAAVAAPVSAPGEALVELGNRVATLLAPTLTRRVRHLRPAVPPPSVEAYSAYVEGLEHFIRGEWSEALLHLRRSVLREPAYALPKIVSAIAHWNRGELAEAEAVAREARELRGELGRFERAVLDMVLAWLEGDWAGAHAAVRIQAELAPGSIPHFQLAEEARRLNRPRETREVLSRLDPQEGELRGWIYYWVELTQVHHQLGDHRLELELAHRCRRLHPDDPVAILLEIRALAALGRPADVERLLDEALARSGRRAPAPGDLLREAALELRVHGEEDRGQQILERAVTWYEEQRDPGRRGPQVLEPSVRLEPSARDHARTLYHAGRFPEARALFTDLAAGGGSGVEPVGHHHPQLQAHLDEGYLAVIAAREGDEKATDRWCAHLEALWEPFLFGSQWFWLAAVAAVRDEPDRAVAFLRRAFAQGLPLEPFLHTDPHLLFLREHRGFQALMRPRG